MNRTFYAHHFVHPSSQPANRMQVEFCMYNIRRKLSEFIEWYPGYGFIDIFPHYCGPLQCTFFLLDILYGSLFLGFLSGLQQALIFALRIAVPVCAPNGINTPPNAIEHLIAEPIAVPG